ncbi:hypothetical protein MHYP_G00285690 [Metynnis hypsauchen]
MDSVASAYLENGDQALETEQLVTMMHVCQKLSVTEDQRIWVIDCDWKTGNLLEEQTKPFSTRSHSDSCKNAFHHNEV